MEDLKGDWLEGRNFCREYCMDLVSLETEAENTFFVKFIKRSKNILIDGQRLTFELFRQS